MFHSREMEISQLQKENEQLTKDKCKYITNNINYNYIVLHYININNDHANTFIIMT